MTTKTALPEGRKHMYTIIAVDTDMDVHTKHSKEWLKYGVSNFRVDSMGEAISQLMSGRKYYFVFVNEDSVPNFASQLEIMRDVTDIPIFIFTSSYAFKKKIKYVELGADMYDSFDALAHNDIIDILETLKLCDRWANRQSKPLPILIVGDIILSELRRVIFVKNIKVLLTRQEFDMLEYFMQNNGITLTSEQIIEKVLEKKSDDIAPGALWNAINRLREKLRVKPDCQNYIETIREVGYRFSGSSEE